MTFRDESRLERLAALQPEPVRADVLDRGAMRRAVKGCDLLFHAAGVVGSNPPDRVWQVNALGPRIAVEAAAAEGVPRVVVTSSVAGIGPAAPGEIGTEEDEYRAGALGLTYVDSKHEGEIEALAAGARHGVEVVLVNPSYVLGVPVDPLPAGRDLHAHDRQLPARAPAGGRGRPHEHRRRPRRRRRPPTRRREGAARRALHPRRARHRVGRADREGRGAVGRAASAGGAATRHRPGRPARRVARHVDADLGRGPRAHGPELALLVAQGARRAGLPAAQAGHHPHGDDRLVQGSDRVRRPSWRQRDADVARLHRDAAGRARAGCSGACVSRSATRGAGWWPAADLVARPSSPGDEYFMRLALREAERALEHDDVPGGLRGGGRG